MPFELFVALRYLTGRRKGLFTLITSGIAVGGVTLGVAALIITLAVMNGFHTEIQKRILGVQSHVVLSSNYGGSFGGYEALCRKIEKIEGVKAVSPFVYGQAVLRKRNASTGAVIKAVQPEKEKNVSSIADYVISGSLQDVKKGIILGRALARSLSVLKGDEVFLVSLSENQPLINLIPRIDRFTVTGIFDSGMYDYDSGVAYISLEAGQKIFGLPGQVTGVGIRSTEPKKADKIARRISAEMPGFWAQPWQMTNKNLFSALKLEKLMMFIILTLIVLVASFNIISNLLLFSIEKVRDIGILTALGVTRKKIGRIFFWEGIMIGCAGIVSGTLLGIVLSFIISRYELIKLPAEVYYISKIPVIVSFTDILTIVLAALIIVIISTLYPAKKAADTDPLEAIRYG